MGNTELRRIQQDIDDAEKDAQIQQAASEAIAAVPAAKQGGSTSSAEAVRQQLQDERSHAETLTNTLAEQVAGKLLEAQPLLNAPASSGRRIVETSSDSGSNAPNIHVKATVNVSVEVSVT